jgi:hypothetical protein
MSDFLNIIITDDRGKTFRIGKYYQNKNIFYATRKKSGILKMWNAWGLDKETLVRMRDYGATIIIEDEDTTYTVTAEKFYNFANEKQFPPHKTQLFLKLDYFQIIKSGSTIIDNEDTVYTYTLGKNDSTSTYR